MSEGLTSAMTTIVGAISTVFDAGMDMLTGIGTAILADPILLFFTALPVVGLGIGIFKRLLSH